MLRTFLILVGVVCAAAGVLLIGGGYWPTGIALLAAGLVCTVSIVFEQHRYKPVVQDRPPPGWVDSGERVVDETIGETVAVYTNPRSGERMYVRVE